MTAAQREMLDIAERQGWVRPTTANDLRVADALVRAGLLEIHPDYDGSVLRPADGAAA